MFVVCIVSRHGCFVSRASHMMIDDSDRFDESVDLECAGNNVYFAFPNRNTGHVVPESTRVS